MTRLKHVLGIGGIVAALCLAVATPHAFAADAKPAPFAAVPKPRIVVQLWPAETVGAVLIVSATLPTSTPLPVTVDVPLPEGASIMWVGEITGLGPQADIEQTATVVTTTAGRALRVTMNTKHEVQYEASWTAPVSSGAKRTAVLKWVQTAGASEVEFGAKLPARAVDVVIKPGPTGEPGVDPATGDKLWVLAPATLAVGDTFDLTIDYTLAADGAAPGPATTDLLLYALIAALVVTVVALVVTLRIQRSRANANGAVDPTDASPPTSKR